MQFHPLPVVNSLIDVSSQMLAIQASPAIPHGTTCSSAQNAACQICYWPSLLMSRWGNALQYSEGGGEAALTWLLPHLFVFLNLHQYLGIKWWKLVLFYVKHFYQSVQSIREQPSWITVNVWNHMLSVISQCLTQLGWSPCDHTLFCDTFRAGPDTEMSLPWYSLFGYSCVPSAWSSAIKFHESHLVLHRPFQAYWVCIRLLISPWVSSESFLV